MKKYKMLLTFNLEKALPSVGNVIDEVNRNMQSFGFSEQIGLKQEVDLGTIEIETDFEMKEMEKLADKTVKEFLENFPNSKAYIELVPI